MQTNHQKRTSPHLRRFAWWLAEDRWKTINCFFNHLERFDNSGCPMTCPLVSFLSGFRESKTTSAEAKPTMPGNPSVSTSINSPSELTALVWDYQL